MSAEPQLEPQLGEPSNVAEAMPMIDLQGHNDKDGFHRPVSMATTGPMGSEAGTQSIVHRPLTMPGLIAIIYYSVCGGPFGTEDVVSAGGPLLALVGFLVMPAIWSVPEALIAAELSTAFPSNAGYTTWVTAAFGPFWGFMEGFLSWLAGVTDSAIYPILFRDYLRHIWPAVAEGWTGYFFVLGLSIGLSVLNYCGLSIVGWSALVLALFTVSPFFYIVPVAFAEMDFSNLLIQPTSWADVDYFGYLNVLFWNLNYWDSASCLAGEVHNPRKTFPTALFITALLVFASYLLPLAAGIGLRGSGGGADWQSWKSGSLAIIGAKTGGYAVKAWVVAASAVSNIGQFISEQAECSFQIMGMAKLGWLPSCLAYRSSFGTPTAGILICLSIVIALATFKFESIVALLNGIYCMAQLLEFTAFLKLRNDAHANQVLRRPYKVPIKSTWGCALMLTCPMCFCLLMLSLPFIQRDLFQILVFFLAPLSGVLLYQLLGLCRRRRWMHFACEPPRGLDDILLAQTPIQRALSSAEGSVTDFHLPEPAVPCNGCS